MFKVKAVAVFMAFSVVTGFCNALMFTLQAVYYVEAAGLNPLQLVLVGTIMEFTALVFEVPTGVLADTVSRRLSVIFGVFITGVGFLIQGLVPRYDAIFIGAAIWGFGWTFMSGAWQAWIAGEVTEEQLQAVLLRAGQFRQIAMLVGIVGATVLGMLTLHVPIVVGSSGTILLGFWLIATMPERGFQPVPRAERSNWSTMRQILGAGVGLVWRSPVLLSVVGIAMLAGGASEGFDRLREAHILQNLRLPQLGNTSAVLWFGIIQVGGQLLAVVALQFGRRRFAEISPQAVPRALLVSNMLTVGALFAFALAPNLGVAIMAWWLLTVVRVISGPLYDSWLARHTDPAVRATVYSVVSQSDSFGQLGIGPVLGVVGTWYGLRAALTLAGCLTFPASVLYWLLTRREERARNGAADVT